MKPMYALHHDANGNVLAAADFTHSFQLQDWLRKCEFRPGDRVSFRECTVRPEFDEVEPAPAFIETPAPSPAPEMAGEDKPF